jgi:hypothetical protein
MKPLSVSYRQSSAHAQPGLLDKPPTEKRAKSLMFGESTDGGWIDRRIDWVNDKVGPTIDRSVDAFDKKFGPSIDRSVDGFDEKFGPTIDETIERTDSFLDRHPRLAKLLMIFGAAGAVGNDGGLYFKTGPDTGIGANGHPYVGGTAVGPK